MRFRSSLLLFSSAAVLAIAVDAFLIEPDALELTRHALEIGVDRPLTIVHLSDLHTHGFGTRERKVVALVREASPDVIVVTGDAVDTGDLEPARELFAQLHAPLGVYVVPGNWEHWRPTHGEVAFYASVGAELLVNERRQIRPDVVLVGLDDPMSGTANLAAATKGLVDGPIRIALHHSPESFDTFADHVDLSLAGHTHGGQVRVPLLGPLWTPPGSGPYVAGWYERGRARMFVSRGVGTSILPVRFACAPEVARIELVPRQVAPVR